MSHCDNCGCKDKCTEDRRLQCRYSDDLVVVSSSYLRRNPSSDEIMLGWQHDPDPDNGCYDYD